MSGYAYKSKDRYSMGFTDPRAFDLTTRMLEPADSTVRKILTEVINPEDREGALYAIVQRDTWHARINWGETEMKIHDDRIYRVGIFPGEIDVLCLGLSLSEPTAEGQYSSADELPLWMQERLAVLMMMSLETPTVELVGVGRRISSHVYWVYKPETTS